MASSLSMRSTTPLRRITTPLSSSSSTPTISIYDKNLSRSRNNELSLACYVLLYNEMIAHALSKVSGVQELEQKLNDYGRRVGAKLFELVVFRERNAKRETRVLGILQFIHTTIWKTLFGRPADSLEKSRDNEDEYMIGDNAPVMTQFISIPRDMSQLDCSAFLAGIVEACLEGAQFHARVTAHATPTDALPRRTTILIKLAPIVLEREAMLTR